MFFNSKVEKPPITTIHIKEMRLFRCWVEDYEVNESRHSQSVSHIREGEGSYDGTPGSVAESGVAGKGKGGKEGKGKGKTKGKEKGKTKGETKPVKEKTEDQLARAAP